MDLAHIFLRVNVKSRDVVFPAAPNDLVLQGEDVRRNICIDQKVLLQG